MKFEIIKAFEDIPKTFKACPYEQAEMDAFEETLEDSVKASDHCVMWSPTDDGPVGAVIGTRLNCVWAIVDREVVEKHPKAWLRAGQMVRDALLQQFPVMVNMVSIQNRPAIRYLESLGAIFDHKTLTQKNHLTFVPFAFIRRKQRQKEV